MKFKKTIISSFCVLAVSVLILTGCSSASSANVPDQSQGSPTSAVGADTQNSGNGQPTSRGFGMAALIPTYETALKDLVTAGTVTQDQSDKVIAALQDAGNQSGANGQMMPNGSQSSAPGTQTQHNGYGGGSRQNILPSLVSSGVLTQAQSDAISQKVNEATISARFEPVLKNLVTDGTITPDQSDKVLAAVVSASAQSSAQSTPPVSPTQGSAQGQGQYRGNSYETDALASLVSGGILTQPQSDAITAALKTGMQGNYQNRGGPNANNQNSDGSQTAPDASGAPSV